MEKRRALQGIKVVDFAWALAAPFATKVLAEHGATVVKVESVTAPDRLRAFYPFTGGVPGQETSGCYAMTHNDKYNLGLNLKHPRGTEVAKKLISWADVVVENFTPQTMSKLGLGYPVLKELKPDIIMISATMQGQTGPHTLQPGYGIQLQSLTGFTHLLSWPDRSPVLAPNAITDWIVPWYVSVVIMAALDYRRQTGKGQYIDLSQFEAGISFLSPVILDYTANGRVQGPLGNRCPYAAPHGAYRCQGDDKWCVIAVFNDKEWQAFCQVIGEPEWTKNNRFATLLGRKKNEDELDRLIEEWTVNHSAEEVMAIMQTAGVAAGPVEGGQELHKDPQLAHRHHFWRLEHSEMGMTAYTAPAFKLSKTPAELRMPAPLLGQHTEYVCTQFLGMSDEEFVELNAIGVFE